MIVESWYDLQMASLIAHSHCCDFVALFLQLAVVGVSVSILTRLRLCWLARLARLAGLAGLAGLGIGALGEVISLSADWIYFFRNNRIQAGKDVTTRAAPRSPSRLGSSALKLNTHHAVTIQKKRLPEATA